MRIILDGFSFVRNKRKDVVLLIIGPLEKRWEQKFQSHPYKNNILITAPVKSSLIPHPISIIDICYLPLKDTPANRGRNPIKLGDYMAAGKPIIANPVGDIAQIIKNYNIGLTIKYSSNDVAQKTLFLLKRPGLIKLLGKNSRKVAERYFDWKILAKKLNEKYILVSSQFFL